MNKLLIITLVCVGILIIAGVTDYYFSKSNVQEIKLYQGPVRPTDDLEHFRLTGETIPLIKE